MGYNIEDFAKETITVRYIPTKNLQQIAVIAEKCKTNRNAIIVRMLVEKAEEETKSGE